MHFCILDKVGIGRGSKRKEKEKQSFIRVARLIGWCRIVQGGNWAAPLRVTYCMGITMVRGSLRTKPLHIAYHA